jgi:hypothetical protein
MEEEVTFDPWQPGRLTKDLERLLKLAIWFYNYITSRNSNEDHSLVSIFCAFLVAKDPVSLWFQNYIRQLGIKEKDFKKILSNECFKRTLLRPHLKGFKQISDSANKKVDEIDTQGKYDPQIIKQNAEQGISKNKKIIQVQFIGEMDMKKYGKQLS